jgi:hypothetical protein
VAPWVVLGVARLAVDETVTAWPSDNAHEAEGGEVLTMR